MLGIKQLRTAGQRRPSRYAKPREGGDGLRSLSSYVFLTPRTCFASESTGISSAAHLLLTSHLGSQASTQAYSSQRGARTRAPCWKGAGLRAGASTCLGSWASGPCRRCRPSLRWWISAVSAGRSRCVIMWQLLMTGCLDERSRCPFPQSCLFGKSQRCLS